MGKRVHGGGVFGPVQICALRWFAGVCFFVAIWLSVLDDRNQNEGKLPRILSSSKLAPGVEKNARLAGG
jgi:hypothetical protein